MARQSRIRKNMGAAEAFQQPKVSTIDERLAARADEESREREADLARQREQFAKEEEELRIAERIDLVKIIQQQAIDLPIAEAHLAEVLMMPHGKARDTAVAAARKAVFDANMFPLEVAMWQILIEMQRPKDRMGRFIKVESQRENEQYLTTVGRVLLCGPTAMSGKTESGIPLDQLTATIKTPEQLIGKYVIIQRYTGNDLFFAPWPVKKLRYITATEILSVTTNPGMWMKQ